MLDQLMNETYTAAEAAAALGHGNFGDFRRNAKRDDLFVIPQREATRYEYANLFEMACQMVISTLHTRETGKNFSFTLFRYFERRVHTTADWQKAFPSIDSRLAIDFGDGEDQVVDKYRLGQFLVAPALLLGADVISRDADRHTHAAYILKRINFTQDGLFLVSDEETTLKSLREKATKVARADFVNERQAYDAAYNAVGLGLIDLTEIANRLDEQLAYIVGSRRVSKAS